VVREDIRAREYRAPREATFPAAIFGKFVPKEPWKFEKTKGKEEEEDSIRP